jgi:hypothetical protein
MAFETPPQSPVSEGRTPVAKPRSPAPPTLPMNPPSPSAANTANAGGGNGSSGGHGSSHGNGLSAALTGCFADDPAPPARSRRSRRPLAASLPEEVFVSAALLRAEQDTVGLLVEQPTVKLTPPPPRPERLRLSDRLAPVPPPVAVAAAPAQPTEPGGLAIGSVVDKYRIDSVIGSGGFSTVYRATHLLLRVPVALKLVKPSLLKDHPYLAGLLCEEAQFAAQISHPNVVRVFDITSNEKMTYIVMEFIEGGNLAEIMGNDPLELREAIAISIDICAGLMAGLAQGLIHRDIKPGNVMLGKDGRARLLDFGLARPMTMTPNRSGVFRKSASFVGTPAFISPEQAQNPDQADFRSDMYSLGVTLYYLTTGRMPFVNKDAMMLVKMHIQDQPPPIDLPGYPKQLARIIMKMMEKQPENRYPDYETVVSELKQVVVPGSGPAGAPGAEVGGTTGLFSGLRNLFKR